MSLKFKDTSNGTLTLNKRDRARILQHLHNASGSVPNAQHAVHQHLTKAAGELGCIVDRSEDNSGMPGDLTSPGTTTRTSPTSRVGQDTGIADPATQYPTAGNKSAKRDATVVALFQKAAQTRDKAERARIESFATWLDSLEMDKSSVPNFSNANRGLRDYGQRHAL